MGEQDVMRYNDMGAVRLCHTYQLFLELLVLLCLLLLSLSFFLLHRHTLHVRVSKRVYKRVYKNVDTSNISYEVASA